jgi:hypothetical protein
MTMYTYVFAVGLRFLHSSATAPPWNTLRFHWYGRVNLIFKIRVRTDIGSVMECQCALIETVFDCCPREGRNRYPSTPQIGTKLLYMPSPNPVVYVVPLSHILGRLPLIPAGDFGTIPRNMSGRGESPETPAIPGARAIREGRRARAASCSTSTCGP